MSQENIENQEDEFTDPTDALYNSVQEGRFIDEDLESFTFQFQDGLVATVEKNEFPEGHTFEKDSTHSLLIERPWGQGWAASIRKLEKLALWDKLFAAAKDGERVEGTIVGQNRGGLTVDIGVRAFLPMSQIDLHRVDDVTPYLGRTDTFEVTKFDARKADIVVSRRRVLEEQLGDRREVLLENLEEGQVFEGIVRNVLKYGCFVDIGGLEGLLHKSNMTWGRLDDPSELVRPGDSLRVVVLGYDEKKKRLSLGRKQLLDDPWLDVEERYSEGDIVDGEVVSLADFGAFIQIDDGLEGLVHVTELSWTSRISHPREVLDIGRKVRVRIIGIDGDERRLSLSIKRLENNPWESFEEDHAPGTRLQGRVTGATEFGVFVEVAPGIDGMVHVQDISWTERIDDARGRFEPHQEIEVMVLDVDAENSRVALGIKQLSDDPWGRAESIAVPGTRIKGTVTRLADFGAFVEITEGIEGLIHISELRDERVERAGDVVKPGQEVEALVLLFDRSNQRISLSLKREVLEEGLQTEHIESQSGATLGDIFRDRLGLGKEEEPPETKDTQTTAQAPEGLEAQPTQPEPATSDEAGEPDSTEEAADTSESADTPDA